MIPNYDNAYAFDNVYGHVVALLRRHRPAQPADEALHLDLGCGYGRMAEVVESELGRRYLGLDLDPAGVQSLRERGMEAHAIDLGASTDSLVQAIEAQLKGRSIASISLVDVLEHIADFRPLLSAVRRLALQHGALFVLSVPNLAHRDVGFKLAFGRYDITDAGILDHTHVHGFTEGVLHDVLAQHGLHPTERNDVRREHSDQAFPPLHPALADQALLATFLREMRDQVDANATVNQFVVACLPGPIEAPRTLASAHDPQARRPFLSVVTHTDGRDAGALRDALVCLAAQDDADFEWIVVGQQLDIARQLVVERILADAPDALRGRIRFLRVDHGRAATALNTGFAAAAGDYIAMLGEADLPMAHWVARFRATAQQAQGTVLRTIAVRQGFEPILLRDGEPSTRATSSFTPSPLGFDLLEHLRGNPTPPPALAFPRSIFHEMCVDFAEHLTADHDWDFLVRAASLCGVTSDESVTCIHRVQDAAADEAPGAQDRERSANQLRIFDRMDRRCLLLPEGATGQLRGILDQIDRLYAEVTALSGGPGRAGAARREDLEIELAALLDSTSWRFSAPLRRVKQWTGGAPHAPLDAASMSAEALHDAIHQIRASTSWRLTAPIRTLKSVLSRHV